MMKSKSGYRILIVEDDEDLRQLLTSFIENDGFVVDVACSGTEAFEKFTTSPFQVVVSDLTMPGGNGLVLLDKLRTLTKNFVFILMTGYSETSDAKYRDLGVARVIHKPFGKKDFSAIIREEIEKFDPLS